jgi:hypothetical protein
LNRRLPDARPRSPRRGNLTRGVRFAPPERGTASLSNRDAVVRTIVERQLVPKLSGSRAAILIIYAPRLDLQCADSILGVCHARANGRQGAAGHDR